MPDKNYSLATEGDQTSHKYPYVRGAFNIIKGDTEFHPLILHWYIRLAKIAL